MYQVSKIKLYNAHFFSILLVKSYLFLFEFAGGQLTLKDVVLLSALNFVALPDLVK